MKSVTRKRYTAEFKAQAVGLVGLGKPVQEVAEDLGIGTSILYGWVRKGSLRCSAQCSALSRLVVQGRIFEAPWQARIRLRERLKSRDGSRCAQFWLGQGATKEQTRSGL